MRTGWNTSARAAAILAAGGLILAGCGDDAEAPGQDAPAATQPPTADDTGSPAEPPATETVTDTVTETEDATPPAETTPDDDQTGGDEPPRAAVEAHATAYGGALADGDWESAYAMLSAESIATLELDGPEDLANEPWIPELLDHLAGQTPVVHSWPAWYETYAHEHAVTLTPAAEGTGYVHAFGVRQVDGEWIIDQSRTDVSTGGTWVEFQNPAWDGTVDAAAPIEFSVGTEAGVPVAVTLHSSHDNEPLATVETEQGDAVVYTAQQGPAGHELLAVSGAIVDNPMVRVHAIVIG